MLPTEISDKSFGEIKKCRLDNTTVAQYLFMYQGQKSGNLDEPGATPPPTIGRSPN